MAVTIDSSADVHDRAAIGDGSTVWHLAQVREDARVGANCVVGRGVYVGAGVRLGDNCKVQNYALLYEPAELEDGVFVGPGVIFTNDRHPRAVNPDGTAKSAHDWEPVGVTVGEGASIGAGATCVAPIRIGAWALVAAGSVVTRDVPDHALVAGAPAQRVGWVGPTGRRLFPETSGALVCPETGQRYVETDGGLAVEEG